MTPLPDPLPKDGEAHFTVNTTVHAWSAAAVRGVLTVTGGWGASASVPCSLPAGKPRDYCWHLGCILPKCASHNRANRGRRLRRAGAPGQRRLSVVTTKHHNILGWHGSRNRLSDRSWLSCEQVAEWPRGAAALQCHREFQPGGGRHRHRRRSGSVGDAEDRLPIRTARDDQREQSRRSAAQANFESSALFTVVGCLADRTRTRRRSRPRPTPAARATTP